MFFSLALLPCALLGDPSQCVERTEKTFSFCLLFKQILRVHLSLEVIGYLCEMANGRIPKWAQDDLISGFLHAGSGCGWKLSLEWQDARVRFSTVH